MSDIEFVPFRKIPRLRRGIVITEKIDGTNAQIHWAEDGTLRVGSRNRWITPESDNYGFAAWAHEHALELSALGPGHHYGEWWGSGIQRGYGLSGKRFSLFNTARWGANRPPPACCSVVPVLYAGPNSDATIAAVVEGLRVNGSVAAPGFMKPEGVVVYHSAGGNLYKVTLEKDDEPKGARATEVAS